MIRAGMVMAFLSSDFSADCVVAQIPWTSRTMIPPRPKTTLGNPNTQILLGLAGLPPISNPPFSMPNKTQDQRSWVVPPPVAWTCMGIKETWRGM